jgi:hypothetical protein
MKDAICFPFDTKKVGHFVLIDKKNKKTHNSLDSTVITCAR